MKRKTKTSSELIIDALRTGEELKLSEITELISQYTGKEIKIQNVSSTMAKLSDSEKTEIGYLINRHKTKQGYTYKLADEALELTPEQTYGLVRKVGKDRYTLKDAIEQVPSLNKYVQANGAKKTGPEKSRKTDKQAPNAKGVHTPGIAFTIGDLQTGEDVATGEQLSQILAQLKSGSLNINLNVNIRFIGFVE